MPNCIILQTCLQSYASPNSVTDIPIKSCYWLHVTFMQQKHKQLRCRIDLAHHAAVPYLMSSASKHTNKTCVIATSRVRLLAAFATAHGLVHLPRLVFPQAGVSTRFECGRLGHIVNFVLDGKHSSKVAGLRSWKEIQGRSRTRNTCDNKISHGIAHGSKRECSKLEGVPLTNRLARGND